MQQIEIRKVDKALKYLFWHNKIFETKISIKYNGIKTYNKSESNVLLNNRNNNET